MLRRANLPKRLLAVIALQCAATSAAAAEAVPQAKAYVGAQVLDIADGSWHARTIVVRDERIEALSAADVPLPPGVQPIEVHGLFAVPGLIDAHQHVASGQTRAQAEAALRREIFGGVTAIRDMAGDARILAGLARDARLGEIAAPDIVYAALAAGPSFFVDPRTRQSTAGATPGAVPWMQAISAATDLPLAIARMGGTGASGVKIYANFDPALMGRIAAEAHRQRLAVWAHGAVFPATARQTVSAGADTVSHICMLAYETLEPGPPQYHDRPPLDQALLLSEPLDPRIAAVLAEMKRRGTVLDATLWVYRAIERMRATMEPGTGPPTYCSSALAERLAAEAFKAGVTIAAGTDASAVPGSVYPALFDEMELLRDKAGLPPIEVLRAATVNGARALGRTAEVGSIAPGMLADIAFLSEDPLRPRAQLRSVVLTLKRGRPYPRRDFVPPTGRELGED